MGLLKHATNDFEQAKKSYEEALEIRRDLAEVNPQIYRPDLAETLNDLGLLRKDKNEFEQAERILKEALTIRQEFAKLFPQIYLPVLAETKVNMAIFYFESYSKKEKSVALVTEVIKIAEQFQQVPIVMQYKKLALEVLQKWNIDIEGALQDIDKNPN